MKVILAALAGAAVTVTGAAIAGPASRPVTQAQVAALTKRVAALERRDTQYDCIVNVTNAQRYEPYLVESWAGFDTKSGNALLFTAPSVDDELAQTGYVVVSTEKFSQC